MGRSLVRPALLVLVGLYCGPLHAQDAIRVDVSTTISDVSRRPFGINLNFLLDDDENRPAALKKLAEGLRAAGVKYLRYPGGEKADGYLWSLPPYTSSIPTLARWAPGEWPDNTEWPSYDRALVEHDGFTFRTPGVRFCRDLARCRNCREARPRNPEVDLQMWQLLRGVRQLPMLMGQAEQAETAVNRSATQAFPYATGASAR